MKRLLLLLGLSAGLAQVASAQSSCSSDGQPTPVLLVERFLSADCEACWRAPPPAPPVARALTLDWIVPSPQGEEAPLSAAASRDALPRLSALGRRAPTRSLTLRQRRVTGRSSQLRVAHGVSVGGYLGASIRFTQAAGRAPKSLSAWLVLVETIAAGTEGSPIARDLVRNVLSLNWDQSEQLLKTEHLIFQEMRPLSIPPGANLARLRVVGWVQDDRGRLLSVAQSVCTPSPPALAP
jgi:hypothetical protein